MAIRAEEIVFSGDFDMIVVLGANDLAPNRLFDSPATVASSIVRVKSLSGLVAKVATGHRSLN